MKPYIIHLTPAIAKNNNFSNNLGDVIIYESANEILSDLFKGMEIISMSTHEYPNKMDMRLIQQSHLSFVGGSNLLSSNIIKYNQWKFNKHIWQYLLPSIKNINILGVGWWQYQNKPTRFTSHFYKTVFTKKNLLSVRDNYSLNQLRHCNIPNIINTSCPTTWKLNGLNTDKNINVDSCVFAITDYLTNSPLDNKLIEQLSYYYKKLYFFPQGAEDTQYLQQLPAYTQYKENISILPRDINLLKIFLTENNRNINYIGTRLHLGIYCLQNNIPSLIIAIDNRATEMGADIRLPIIKRENIMDIKKWIENNVSNNFIHLPVHNIERWKNQFIEYL